MAKTESTAVNDLIALVNQPPVRPSSSEELHFDARERSAAAARLAPRASNNASMAPSSATGAPLPRNRAPNGTASNLIPPRRSTALPPPRPTAQIAVPDRPKGPAILAIPAVAPPPFVRIAWPSMPHDGPSTEPIDQLDLILELDDDVDVDAVVFDDDEIAFDGAPHASVPTAVMAQTEIDRLASESSRAGADMVHVDAVWTPNSAAPLTLDDTDSDFVSSDTSPFLPEMNRPRPPGTAMREDSAVMASMAYPPRAASAPVIEMPPWPGPRATSSMPVLPDTVALSWPTDFGPIADPTTAAVDEAIPTRADITAQKFTASVPKPKKIVTILPVAAGLAVVGLFAGGYLYLNDQPAPQPATATAPNPIEASTIQAVGLEKAAPPTVPPTVPPTDTATPVADSLPAAAPAAVAASALAPEALPATLGPATPGPLPTVAGTALPSVPATAASASLVNILFESSPAGATVTLIDRGRTSLIGTTPINAALDSSYKYEIIFSLDGRATKIAKLDPQKKHTVKTVLPAIRSSHRTAGSTAVAAVTVPPTKPAAVSITKSDDAAQPAATGRTMVANEIAGAGGPAGSSGSGIVMISSKPPCEIVIDGKATGLMTPQRNLTMTAGPHTITLLNKPNGIKKVLSVQVSAGKSTKLVQDYTALIKK